MHSKCTLSSQLGGLAVTLRSFLDLVTACIRRMGKVLFSQACLCPQGQGTHCSLVPGSFPSFWLHVLSVGEGVPQSCHWSSPNSCPRSCLGIWKREGYPNLGQRYHPLARTGITPRTGYPTGLPVLQMVDRTRTFVRRRRYASCFHGGRLSCS